MNEKAVQLFSKIYLDKDASSFKTSPVGYTDQSVRYGMGGIMLLGESLSADTSDIDK